MEVLKALSKNEGKIVSLKTFDVMVDIVIKNHFDESANRLEDYGIECTHPLEDGTIHFGFHYDNRTKKSYKARLKPIYINNDKCSEFVEIIQFDIH